MKRARSTAKKSRPPEVAESRDGEGGKGGGDGDEIQGGGGGGGDPTLDERLCVYRQVATFRASAVSAATVSADPSFVRRGVESMNPNLLQRMMRHYVKSLDRDATADWRHLKAWCDASLDDPLTDSRPARSLPSVRIFLSLGLLVRVHCARAHTPTKPSTLTAAASHCRLTRAFSDWVWLDGLVCCACARLGNRQCGRTFSRLVTCMRCARRPRCRATCGT
jgi:hypothetical protein